jgi:hypothetical protein
MTTLTASEYRQTLTKAKPNKYRAKPTVVDGLRFASKAEARCYSDLKILEAMGEITGLKLQPRYPLVVAGLLVCTYVADFEYVQTNTGRIVTEDTKGVKTKDFIIKAKLFHALYGREVTLS